MNSVLCESLYELNNIIAECNSQYIYESIMMESDIIDVDYKEVDKDDSNSMQKSKTFLEKVKAVWKAFVATMKKMIKACIQFIKKNLKMIKDTSDVRVCVEDRSYLIDAFKELNADTKSGKAFDNIYKHKKNLATDYYISKHRPNNDIKILTMEKSDAIRFLEKQLNEAEKLIEEFDKEVDKLLKFHDDNKNNMKKSEAIINKYKVELVNSARTYYKNLISHIVNDIEELTTKKSDMKEKE